jgi:hypothetical protein
MLGGPGDPCSSALKRLRSPQVEAVRGAVRSLALWAYGSLTCALDPLHDIPEECATTCTVDPATATSLAAHPDARVRALTAVLRLVEMHPRLPTTPEALAHPPVP